MCSIKIVFLLFLTFTFWNCTVKFLSLDLTSQMKCLITNFCNNLNRNSIIFLSLKPDYFVIPVFHRPLMFELTCREKLVLWNYSHSFFFSDFLEIFTSWYSVFESCLCLFSPNNLSRATGLDNLQINDWYVYFFNSSLFFGKFSFITVAFSNLSNCL